MGAARRQFPDGYQRIKEAANIAQVRKLHALPQIKMGPRACLICDNEFFSEDLKNQKCCDYCRTRKDEE